MASILGADYPISDRDKTRLDYGSAFRVLPHDSCPGDEATVTAYVTNLEGGETCRLDLVEQIDD